VGDREDVVVWHTASSGTPAPGRATALGGTALSAALACAGAAAQQAPALPLWELGAGVGVASVPDYPGSDQRQNYVLPVPYVIYRGDIFKADRDGVRARFAGTPRFELDLSFGATTPVPSQDSDARRGMPNLPVTVELGPELRVHLARDSEDESLRRYEVNLQIPVRHSETWMNGHPVSVGNVADPHLNWRQKFRWLGRELNIDADLGAVFNDRRYDDFFYGVQSRYATATRAAYQAPGGYGGWYASAITSQRIDRLRIAAYVGLGSVGGSAFEDSPLVRRNVEASAGLAFTYVFWVSERTVSRQTAADPDAGAR